MKLILGQQKNMVFWFLDKNIFFFYLIDEQTVPPFPARCLYLSTIHHGVDFQTRGYLSSGKIHCQRVKIHIKEALLKKQCQFTAKIDTKKCFLLNKLPYQTILERKILHMFSENLISFFNNAEGGGGQYSNVHGWRQRINIT